jgi:hypothetical protein
MTDELAHALGNVLFADPVKLGNALADFNTDLNEGLVAIGVSLEGV